MNFYFIHFKFYTFSIEESKIPLFTENTFSKTNQENPNFFQQNISKFSPTKEELEVTIIESSNIKMMEKNLNTFEIEKKKFTRKEPRKISINYNKEESKMMISQAMEKNKVEINERQKDIFRQFDE